MNVFELRKHYFPSWYFERVINPETIENYKFYKKWDEKYCYGVEIDVDLIKGTTHPNYNNNKTWFEMFLYLERHQNQTDIELTKKVINDETKEKKSLLKLGDFYYIMDGNHRICLSKFLNYEKIVCDIIEYPFDSVTFNLFKQLEKLQLSPEVKVHSQEWNIKLGNLSIFLKKNSEVEEFIYLYNSIKLTKWDKIKLLIYPDSISQNKTFANLLDFKKNLQILKKAKLRLSLI